MVIGIDGNEANVKNRVGSGQFAFEVIRNLVQVDKENSYRVYLKEEPLADLPKEGGNLKYLVFGPKKLWTQIALPARLFLGRRPDVFFSPSHYSPRFSSCPRVVTVFDLSFIFFPELFRKSDLYQLENWTNYSVSKATAVITISESSKKDIVEHYNILPKKVSVCYPGYEKSSFRKQNREAIEAIRKKYKIKGEYLFYLGTIQPRKNLIRLLDAIQNLDIKLVVSGKKGWLYDDFFEKAQRMGDRVIITDYTPDEDLPALLSGAKAFVLPSLYEGFGIPVLEAMACGCPVVVSRVSSLPEVVGGAGILVNPNSVSDIKKGIEKVLRNETLANDLSQKGLVQAQKFSWEACAKNALSILEKVASR